MNEQVLAGGALACPAERSGQPNPAQPLLLQRLSTDSADSVAQWLHIHTSYERLQYSACSVCDAFDAAVAKLLRPRVVITGSNGRVVRMGEEWRGGDSAQQFNRHPGFNVTQAVWQLAPVRQPRGSFRPSYRRTTTVREAVSAP